MNNLLRCLSAAIVVAAIAPLAFAQEADLSVSKTGPEFAAADTDVTYTVMLTNIGPDPALSVTLSDEVPAGMTFVSSSDINAPGFSCSLVVDTVNCSALTLGAGASVEFTFVFHIAPGTPPGTAFTNAAVGDSTTDDPIEENDVGVAVTTTPFPPQADIFVLKNGPASAGPGTDVTYTISIGNAGPDAATDIVLTDTLPGDLTFVSLTQVSGPAMMCTTPAGGSGGTVDCSASSFPANATATFELTVHIPAGAVVGTTYENTASGSSKTEDPVLDNNSGAATALVNAIDVSVIKSGNTTATAGTDFTYTLDVANGGGNTATNVDLIDALPPGTTFVSLTQNNGPFSTCSMPPAGSNGTVSCYFPTFGNGLTAQFTLVVHIGDTLSITNTATVSATEFDTDGGNNESELTTTVSPRADRSVVKNGPTTVVAGETADYTITVGNDGPSTAFTVSLTDTLPANTTFVGINQTSGPTFNCMMPAVGATGTITCSIASLAPGANATFDVVFDVSPSAPSGSTIANTASLASTTPDDIGGNNSSTTTAATVTTSADLSAGKAGPSAAGAGLDILYTVTASNLGPSDAANAVVTDTLPANTTFVSADQTSGPTFNCVNPAVGGTGAVTCTIASFGANATAIFEIVVHVSPTATNGSTLNNVVTIASNTTDPVPTNNSVSLMSTVAAIADLRVTKSGPTSVAAGADATYLVTLTNRGPADATSVALTEMVPPQTTLVSLTQSTGPAFTCGGTTCTIATLAAGATATFSVVLHVSPTAVGTIQNTVTASATTADPTPSNSASSSSADVTPGTTDVSIAKSADSPRIVPGTDARFTIVVTNNGPAIAYDVTVTDILPPGTTFVSATPTQGSCSGTSTVTCSIGTLSPSGTATITLIVTVSSAGGSFPNTATVTAANADSAPLNNASTAALFGAFDTPLLSPVALMMLAMMLAVVAAMVLRR